MNYYLGVFLCFLYAAALGAAIPAVVVGMFFFLYAR